MMFSGGRPICFLIVAGSGMPGVGVRPGFTPFLIWSGPGIPGVGVVPLGRTTAPLLGMPGTLLTGSGLPDRPGGIFAGSSFMTFAFVVTEAGILVLVLALGADEPQAIERNAAATDIT